MTQMPSYRQLRRSQTDRKVSGVCGGIAEYYNVDPTLIRLAFVALTVITGGAFLIAYIVAIFVMPEASAAAYPYPAPNYYQNTTPPRPTDTRADTRTDTDAPVA
jgi:phage shock protein PspC (stress-responsive transcriptional regulator)